MRVGSPAAFYILLQHELIRLPSPSGKAGLLLWCQRMTKDYDNVNIKNFSTSWSDGLAFAALLHKTYPDCLDYAALSADDPATTLAEAFRVAEEVCVWGGYVWVWVWGGVCVCVCGC